MTKLIYENKLKFLLKFVVEKIIFTCAIIIVSKKDGGKKT